MNQLQIINKNGNLVIDSREFAQMVNMRHADIL
jgi:phage regulator Rha-like protein